MNLQEFQQLPVLGILRGGDKEILPALAETLVAAGLKTVEITMNTPQAVGMIRQMVRSADGRLTVGAGTVLTREDAKAACDAGATFIVSPVLIGEVADFCVNQAIPFFPGALTPQEIYQAWHAGAAMVKVFPAKFFGPDYFREIKGPFEDVALLACGGVTPGTLSAYFASGASAVAFGGSVFRRELLNPSGLSRIEEDVRLLIQAHHSILNNKSI
ncbi:MAG TPA: bifunctional 4-hydroxy-2-oxoglutarate aldolase/2-dehydro-3-deoxy-phosphogluconate aldolase [Candidatus Omnitrophota bacterium]|nr:bifunctional 4-hydroxy-2-oxoglutarate aldolase/2-dehydro-3-deoxy-phosphogluconate aldolase [Candidatus Omnitrophota bacterium]